MPNKKRTGAGGRSPKTHALQLAARLAEAERLRSAGQLTSARRECEAILRDAPTFVGALHSHGLICLKLEDFEKAYQSLAKANDLYPDDCKTLTALARAKTHLEMEDSAVRDLEAALALEPGNIAALNTLAEIHMLHGALDECERVLRDIVARDLDKAENKVLLARCLLRLGKMEESRAVLKGVGRVGYLSPKVLNAISGFPVDPGLVDLVDVTDRIAGCTPDEQADIHFVRGTGLHWAGRHEEAWEMFCAANAQRSGQTDVDRERRQKILRQCEAMPVVASERGVGVAGPRPLYVVGASRSGKSVVERLLGEIPGVVCGYENGLPFEVMRRVVDGARCAPVKNLYDMPPELGPSFCAQLRGAFRERARGARIFVSAGPEPIGDALTLKSLVPECRFVFMKRGRRDQAFRIFMSNYHHMAFGAESASDLGAINRLLDWYEQLIDICAARMPGACLVLTYEDVVQDPAKAVAQVLELCGVGDIPVDLPHIGDDRGVADPYARWLDPALGL